MFQIHLGVRVSEIGIGGDFEISEGLLIYQIPCQVVDNLNLSLATINIAVSVRDDLFDRVEARGIY